MGKRWKQWQTLFSWASKSLWTVTAAMKLRQLLLGRKVMTNLDGILKSRDITLLMMVHIVKAMVFPVVMYGCESSTIKTAEHWRIDAFSTVVLEKTLESPLDSKEIKPVNPKGNQPWIFTGWTDPEAEAPILWLPVGKSWLIGKNSDAGKDWGQEEKGMTEDEMVGWHHWLDGHESEEAPGVGDGRGSLACCSAWCCKESDTTEQLNSHHRQNNHFRDRKKNYLNKKQIYIRLIRLI